MPDPDAIPPIAKVVTEVVKAVPVYEDAVQPAARQVGLALETVAKTVRVALFPISALVWGYEKIGAYLDARLSEKLQYTPPGRITTPPPNVAGPAIEALRFTGDVEELREMYASLLATAMDSATMEKAHPAFVDAIRQLTADEARALRVLADGQFRPVVSVYARLKDGTGDRIASRHQSMIDVEAKVARPALMPSYLDNLERLGLIEIPHGRALVGPPGDPYQELESDPAIQGLCNAINREPTTFAHIERMYVRLTDFGQHFVAACVLERPKPASGTG
jgi:hypothetical protein